MQIADYTKQQHKSFLRDVQAGGPGSGPQKGGGSKNVGGKGERNNPRTKVKGASAKARAKYLRDMGLRHWSK
jgi:hypothetical protein